MRKLTLLCHGMVRQVTLHELRNMTIVMQAPPIPSTIAAARTEARTTELEKIAGEKRGLEETVAKLQAELAKLAKKK